MIIIKRNTQVAVKIFQNGKISLRIMALQFATIFLRVLALGYEKKPFVSLLGNWKSKIWILIKFKCVCLYLKDLS